MEWTEALLSFWFGLAPEQWWKADPELDAEIAKRFLKVWREERESVPTRFLGDARTALAAVILFDQVPRNLFRGEADQFSTDPLALAIAGRAVDAGLDRALEPRERSFLYMPFMHSEDRADQQRSLLLFAALGDSDQLAYAKRHAAIVDRFGRFPHRNQVLGRSPRPDEIAAGDVTPF